MVSLPSARTAAPGGADADGADLRRASRALMVLLGVAFVVSIVHYTDNYLGYEHYPQSKTLPNPSAGAVLASWFFFTAFGIAGLVLLLRQSIRASAICLAVYSGSGLVGLGHYAVPGAIHLAWWRQLHIISDIACGAAILAFSVWMLQRRPAPRRPAAAQPPPG